MENFNEKLNLLLDSVETPTGTYYSVTVYMAINELNATEEQITSAINKMYPPLTLPKKREKYLAELDILAGKVRSAIVSPGEFVEEEYRLAYEEANTWQKQGFEGNPPESVRVWYMNNSFFKSAREAALDIIKTRTLFESVILSVRSVRLEGKAAIREALPEDIDSVADSYMIRMKNILPN